MNKILKQVIKSSILRDKIMENPVILLDIGAGWHFNKNWLDMINKKVMKLIAFEPQFESFNFKFNKENIRFFDVALFNKKDRMQFFITKNRQCSSILEPNNELLSFFSENEDFKIEQTINISTEKLDDFLIEKDIDNIDLIKIDAQGVTYEILEGSLNSLKKACAVEIEAEFIELYKNEKLFSVIHTFLAENNFSLFDMQRVFWKYKSCKNYFNIKGQLAWCNALYFKNIGWFNKQDDYNKILNSIIIFILYNRIDYAYEIFNLNNHKLPVHIYQELNKIFNNKYKIFSIPQFKGRYRIIKFIDRIRQLFSNNNGQLNDLEIGD